MTYSESNHRKRIVVVDDEVAIADTLQVLLARDGIEVRVAYNGQEALEMVQEERPHLVLSDVMMPVLDGRELCRRLRADPAICHIAIILMSATHGRDVRQYGADGFIRKPFDLLDVTEMVDRLLASVE